MTTTETTEFAVDIAGADRIGKELVQRLSDVCDRVEDSTENDVLLIHLTGADAPAGPHPDAGSGPGGSGSDAGSHPDVDIQVVNKWERALRRLERLPVATVALVDGVCQGAGAEVLLTTDHRIAHPSARFALPAGNAGWPGMSLFRMAGQLGRRARRLALFGGELSAEQALDIGLIDEIDVSPEAAAARGSALFAGARSNGVAVRRQLLAEAVTTSFEDALGSHLAACDRVLRAARH
ncbi:enoyl-CoA-hydratase DpgB [Streptomyces iconiensis]|uniref:Enoyl-CoA hydratase/isomerase family protein n=1 Tax=Streptomyces iconiensis TaxID=1384038 RepID=A0ABT7A0C8_9ACTN|nr:enoyl-CoA-hydratase DpgB [Streptomyces iconiensis]MDJ1134780.1 enoyl-CoA hydratase/isomerase family protein [Streptomyces iconiensis]